METPLDLSPCRERPVAVHAIRITRELLTGLPRDFTLEGKSFRQTHHAFSNDACLVYDAIEGSSKVLLVGGYLIRTKEGGFTNLSAEDFAKKYEGDTTPTASSYRLVPAPKK